MYSVFLGETKQFLSSSSSLTESKRDGKQQSSQGISNTVIQEIASKHFIDMVSQDGCKTRASIDKVLQGEKSELDEISFCQLTTPDLPPLPLSDEERTQLTRLLKQFPVSVQKITLLDVLGFTVHFALAHLSKAARADKNHKLYSILETTKKQFCRHWLIGALSQVRRFLFKSDFNYTQEEFFKHIEYVFKTVQTQGCLTEVQENKKHYQDALHAMSIILKLSKAQNPLQFLQDYTCYQMKELTPWLPKETKNPEEEYQGIQAFIDFVICAFENTAHIQTGADKITPVFSKIKNIYEFIHQAQFVSAEENNEGNSSRLLVQIFEVRKYLLNTFLQVFEYQMLQKDELSLIGKGERFNGVCFLSNYDLVKCQNIAGHHGYYFQFLEEVIFFLEGYAKHIVPAHVTAHACLIRIDTVNKLFCGYATGEDSNIYSHPTYNLSKVISLLIDPSMAFLCPEDQGAFLNSLTALGEDANQLFKLDQKLVEYAEKKLQAKLVEKGLNIILEYKSLYSMIVNFLDTINPALDALQEAHSQQLIQLVDRLSVETCREHRQAILHFFESVLFHYMKRFFLVALLKEDLDTLLPSLSKDRTIAFSETSIVSYFCMLKFEEYFLAKIAPAAFVEPSVTLEPLLVHVASNEKASPELDGPEGEMALESLSVVALVAEAPMEKKLARKHKKKGGSEKKAIANRPMATLAANFTPSLTPLSPRLIIRRGEKLDRIFKMLGENGLAASYSKGGHTTLANSNGYKVTVPVHSPHLSHTVRRSIVERVNNMPRA